MTTNTADVLAVALAQVGIVIDDREEQYALDHVTAAKLLAELVARHISLVDDRELRAIASSLRALSRRTKTIYGGSDFCPADYKVPNFSPIELTRLIDQLDTALTAKPSPSEGTE